MRAVKIELLQLDCYNLSMDIPRLMSLNAWFKEFSNLVQRAVLFSTLAFTLHNFCTRLSSSLRCRYHVFQAPTRKILVKLWINSSIESSKFDTHNNFDCASLRAFSFWDMVRLVFFITCVCVFIVTDNAFLTLFWCDREFWNSLWCDTGRNKELILYYLSCSVTDLVPLLSGHLKSKL